MLLGQPGVSAAVVQVAQTQALQFLAHQLAGGGYAQALGLHLGAGGSMRRAGALQEGGQRGGFGFEVGKGVELALVGCGFGALRFFDLGGVAALPSCPTWTKAWAAMRWRRSSAGLAGRLLYSSLPNTGAAAS